MKRLPLLIVIAGCIVLLFVSILYAQDKELPSTQTAKEKEEVVPKQETAKKQDTSQKKVEAVAADVKQEAIKKKAAQAAVAADSDSYIIGAEDVLHIYVWREDTLTKTVPVRKDGKISIPLVDDMQAAGLTPLKLKEILTEKLKDFVDNPDVTVIVLEANSYKVYLTGEVKAPGVYKLKSDTTLVQLLIMAGGFTEWANQKRIQIIRKEDGKEKRITVNYKKIIEGAGSDADVALKVGDIIVVPQ